jgi:hypothetical protein
MDISNLHFSPSVASTMQNKVKVERKTLHIETKPKDAITGVMDIFSLHFSPSVASAMQNKVKVE